MFSPASLKLDSPTPIDEILRKRYILIYLMIIFLSFLPISIFEYGFIFYLWRENIYWIFFLLIPFNIIIIIYILQLGALFLSFLLLTICKLVYNPKEGIFQRNIDDKNYRYWNLRNMIKKWPLFIMATNPFPWLKNRFTLRFFGVKIGKRTICDNCWISSEFVEIGDNVIIGMGTTILSFGIEQDKFIIKKIIIKNDTLIGAKCVLLPGTIMKKSAKLGVYSFTNYDSVLEENSVYIGNPAKIKQKSVRENV
ncbi:MAG: hypothetical protein KGD57_06650 [Candidatus Lokiarchaeota archaeon]|nr:hypothetical protein [Candidatus Lokiarchaeota archaeon]